MISPSPLFLIRAFLGTNSGGVRRFFGSNPRARGGVCRGLRAVSCAWVFQGRPRCAALPCPQRWDLASRNSSADTLLFTCVSRGTNGAYIQSICHGQALSHRSICCLLRQMLMRCVSSGEGVLARILKCPRMLCAAWSYSPKGSHGTIQRYYFNPRLSCSFLLVFPSTLISVYFNSLNHFLLFGA